MANENEGSKPGQQPESKRKFSQQQYDLLKRCSDKKNMTEWNQWRKDHPDEEIRLQEADLKKAYLRGAHLENAWLWNANLKNANLMLADLENAYLSKANLENAYLERANLQAAKLWRSNLQDANFTDARLQGAILSKSNLKGAKLETVIVDGETAVWEPKIDRKTNFSGAGLANVRIDTATKLLLEYNIRRLNWEQWYKKHFLLQWPVKLFWSFSDYGINTWRIIGWFFLLSLAFAAIYANCACWWPPGIVNNLDVEPHLPLWHYFLLVLLRPVYFSIVTMTTLGFGDMHANETSILGHALLTVQVILGYVLLGALVTRFAVLFTAGGPAGKFAPTITKVKGDERKD